MCKNNTKKVISLALTFVLALSLFAGISLNVQADDKYTIIFDGNGATEGNTANLEIPKDATSTTIPYCGYKKTGYYFSGWEIAENMPVLSPGPVSESLWPTVKGVLFGSSDTVTLKAKWTEGSPNFNPYEEHYEKISLSYYKAYADGTITSAAGFYSNSIPKSIDTVDKMITYLQEKGEMKELSEYQKIDPTILDFEGDLYDSGTTKVCYIRPKRADNIEEMIFNFPVIENGKIRSNNSATYLGVVKGSINSSADAVAILQQRGLLKGISNFQKFFSKKIHFDGKSMPHAGRQLWMIDVTYEGQGLKEVKTTYPVIYNNSIVTSGTREIYIPSSLTTANEVIEFMSGRGYLDKLSAYRSIDSSVTGFSGSYSSGTWAIKVAKGNNSNSSASNQTKPASQPAKVGTVQAVNGAGESFTKDGSGEIRCYNKDGSQVKNDFKCDGVSTYFFQADGTAMKDRLTYHPDGVHVIYFDDQGHEVFSNFAHVKKAIAGNEVDDFCFFDVYGHLYVDVLTYDQAGQHIYYANPYGVMEVNKWFQFSNNVKWADGTPADANKNQFGFANYDGTLATNSWTYDFLGRWCYLQGNGAAFY